MNRQYYFELMIQIIIILLLIFTLQIILEKPKSISTWFYVYKVCMVISIFLNFDLGDILLHINDTYEPVSEVCPCCNAESGCNCDCELYIYIDPNVEVELIEGPCCACGEPGAEVSCEYCDCVYHEQCKPENSTTYTDFSSSTEEEK
jgi:hypothetical protein